MLRACRHRAGSQSNNNENTNSSSHGVMTLCKLAKGLQTNQLIVVHFGSQSSSSAQKINSILHSDSANSTEEEGSDNTVQVDRVEFF